MDPESNHVGHRPWQTFLKGGGGASKGEQRRPHLLTNLLTNIAPKMINQASHLTDLGNQEVGRCPVQVPTIRPVPWFPVIHCHPSLDT